MEHLNGVLAQGGGGFEQFFSNMSVASGMTWGCPWGILI